MGSFEQLKHLTEAAYQADLAKLQQVTQAETRLHAMLDDLDRQLHSSLSETVKSDPSWRALGADEAWRIWVMRRRAEVNAKLAQLLIRKGQALDQLKYSFARNQVSGEILDRQNEERRIKSWRAR